MVHKRGLGSLPKGLEWIEPRLDLEENTIPEQTQELIQATTPASSPFLKTITTVQAAVLPEEPEITQGLLTTLKPTSEVPATNPVAVKLTSQKKIAITKVEEPENSASLKGLKEGWTRATFIVKEEQVEKLKAVAYWERITVKEVIEEAFTLYLQNKNVRKVPTRTRS